MLNEKNNRPTNGHGFATNGHAVLMHEHKNGHANGYEYDGDAVKKGTRHAAIEDAVRAILKNVGENPDRDGLLGTPNRVARAYDELLAGYEIDPIKLINNAMFDVEYDEMIVVKDIEFFSMCEHHMLPFYGRAHVAYLPGEKVVGLSKIPRIVDMFARRLQIQERMTHEIAELIDEMLAPRGVAVVVEASHMCAQMRGVEKEHTAMVTTAFLGEFKTSGETRQEFYEHLRRSLTYK